MSMLGISGLKEIIINKHITRPDLILNNLRDYIIDSLQQSKLIEESNNVKVKDGMDMAICTIDLEKSELEFAGAYNPLYIVKNQKQKVDSANSYFQLSDIVLYELKGDKMPIAYYDKMNSFELQTIQITKGDNIYLLSDGFEDQFGGSQGKKLKAKALKQLLCDNSKFEMDIQKQNITEALISWKGDNEQVDDITLIGIKI